jgi:hypothetical protein
MPATGAGLDMKLKSASNTVRWLYEFLDAGYVQGSNNSLSPYDFALNIAGGGAEKKTVYENLPPFLRFDR